MEETFSVKFQQIVLVVLTGALIALMVFYGCLPPSYDLKVGSVVSNDIYANRTFVDTYQTEYEALLARNAVSAIFARSEDISDQNVDNIENFFTLVRQSRELMVDEEGKRTEVTDDILDNLKNNLNTVIGVIPEDEDLIMFLSMTNSGFNYMADKSIAITELIMMDNITTDALEGVIDEELSSFETTLSSFQPYVSPLSDIMKLILVPNAVYDSEATAEAGENAYSTAISDPVMVEKGTKVVASGDMLTEHTYQQLVDLELIRDESFNVIIFVREAVYVALVVIVALIYIVSSGKTVFSNMRVTYTMVVTFLIPIAVSVYVSDISELMSVVLFLTTIAATYIGMSAGIILSLVQILLVWPLYNFDMEFAFVSVVGVIVCAAIAGKKNKSYNSASLIIFPTLFCVISSLAYCFANAATQNQFIEGAIWAGLSSMISIVAAIGLMPLYELFSNSVSPVRLIELSQPGHPLLKKLSLEASGTYNHSIMVANLADSAAEAVGADTLLCKVASYYHDIGKLENPMFFTENQNGYNPHDELEPLQSVRIITNHIIDGVRFGKKYHLPEPIIKIIDEHHGTTFPGYFYSKACDIAAESGLEKPDIEDYKYKGNKPSSKESAIIMIADTCEAAIRSKKITDVDEAENTIRMLIRGKIDQDQLSDSGLSFDDLEKITLAFKQIYKGVFHERIKYPDDNKSK